MLQLCGFHFSHEVIAKVIAAADTNHNGVIDREEFAPMMLALSRSDCAP